MIRIIFLLVIIFVGLLLGIQLKNDPGYVLIALHNWSIEMSFWVALALILITFLFLYAIFSFFHNLRLIPSHYREWRVAHRARVALKTTNRGIIEYYEGHWQLAKNNLIKAIPDSSSPLLHYLTAAKAAQKLGDKDLRNHYLHEAEISEPTAGIAIKLTLAELQLNNQEWGEAELNLKELQKHAPRDPNVLKFLMQLYQAVHDWPQLIALLPQLRKYKIIDDDAWLSIRKNAYLQSIENLISLNDSLSLALFVKKLPKDLKFDEELVAPYAAFLIENHQESVTEPILRESLQHKYNETLMLLYGKFYLNEKQLHFAESLIKKEANSSELYLSLGRLALHQNLWGKAKNYLEKSVAIKANPEAYQELGKLYEQLGEQDKALLAYKQGFIA